MFLLCLYEKRNPFVSDYRVIMEFWMLNLQSGHVLAVQARRYLALLSLIIAR